MGGEKGLDQGEEEGGARTAVGRFWTLLCAMLHVNVNPPLLVVKLQVAVRLPVACKGFVWMYSMRCFSPPSAG